MADTEIVEDRAKLKQIIVKVLECVAGISSAASVANPLFGLAGSLIRAVLNYVDDEEIQTLRQEFSSINEKLDEISKQNHHILQEIKKKTLDSQYNQVEENIKHQFRKFMEVVEAQPENMQCKRDNFKTSFEKNGDDQNLQTLYEGVKGNPKLFSKPILDVYLTYSKQNRQVMENLCTRLNYLFCIGLIALMAYSAIIGDDEESLSEEWARKMEEVQEKMQEALRECE